MECNAVTMRWIKTSVVLLSILSAGITIGIFSPTLPDMTILMSSTTAAMSTTLIFSGISGLAGAIVLGPLFDKFDGMGVLAGCSLMQGIVLAVTPWSPKLIGFQLLAAVTMFFNVGITAGSVSVNCVIWKKQPAMISPVVQVTDLIHALGAALAPQIIAPFLGLRYKSPANSSTIANYTDMSDDLSYLQNTAMTTDFSSFTMLTTTVAAKLSGEVQLVQIAYILVGLISVIVAVACLVLYLIGRGSDDSRLKSYEYDKHRMIRRRSYSLNEDGTSLLAYEEPRARERSDTTGGLRAAITLQKNTAASRTGTGTGDLRRLLHERRLQRQQEREKSTGAHGGVFDSTLPDFSFNRRMVTLVVIICTVVTLNGGRDALLTGLLFTYLNALGWSDQAGTLMVTFYHVTRVVVHAVVVVIAKWVSPFHLTIVNFIILVASSGFMLATVHASSVFLGISIILTGFATSNLHPTIITLAQCSFKVNGKMMGVLFSGLSAGQIVFSPIAGALLQSAGAVSFPFLLLTISVSGAILFVPWTLVARDIKRVYQREATPFDEIVVDNVSECQSLLNARR